MRNRTWASLIGVIAVLAILVGINIVVDSRLANTQLDLTQGRVYTLSRGTRTVLRGLTEPITLRLFFSRQLGTAVPTYGAYADRVRELLTQYAGIAAGKIKLEFYDPEPFSDTEDRALGYGLQGVPLDQGGDQVYFGLAGSNLLDDERQIGFFKPERERFLEYDITRLIYELSNPRRPIVGVMSSLPVDGDPRQMMMRTGGGRPFVSMLQLRQTVTLRTIATDAAVIDPDIQVLMVIHPQALSEATLYAIDQFVMRGGRLMLFVDPASETQALIPDPSGQTAANTSSDAKTLLDAWGIAFNADEVVGDLRGAWRVRASASDRVQAVDYVAWFNIRDGISKTDPATADLQQVTVAGAGHLERKPDAPIEFLPLLTSSDRSGVIAAERVRQNPDPTKILADFRPSGGPFVIAARIRGVLHSAFPAAPVAPPPPPPAPQPGAPPPPAPPVLPPYRAQSDGPANLVVVADSDIVADRFWVRVQDFFGQQEATPFSDNGSFIANVVGTLAGGDALIGLRSRSETLRPFDRIDNMRREAEATFRQTQQTLQAHLEETQQKLRALRQNATGGQPIVNAEQRAAIDAAQKEIVDTRQRLRQVQLDLRRDISALETRLRLINIAGVATVLTLVAIVIGLVRRRRRALARA